MMYRAVCMQHKVQLSGKLSLYPKPEGADLYRFMFDTSYMYCAVLGRAYAGMIPPCSSRWYIVDDSGLMMPQDFVHTEDKPVFARVDPFKYWYQNLGISRT